MLSYNQNVIYDWEKSHEPLSSNQINAVLDLKMEIKQLTPFNTVIDKDLKEKTEVKKTSQNENDSVSFKTSRDFLEYYNKIENDWFDREDLSYKYHLDELERKKSTCTNLLEQVEGSLKNLNELNKKYLQVSFKTNSLHQVSEKLSDDQTKLVELRDGVLERLNHFKSLDKISQALDTGMLSSHSSNIEAVLDEINDHISYHLQHNEFKESFTYGSRYVQCLRRLLSQIKDTITSGLIHATTHATSNATVSGSSQASHYAKFLASTHSIRKLTAILESRMDNSNEYEIVVNECQQCYVDQREILLGPSVQSYMSHIVSTSSGDYCSLMRSACSFLIHVSQDEYQLYHQFFTKQNEIFNKYVEGLCQSLYDTIRPIVIHIKHLETLAELCSILRMEMLQEHVNNNEEALGSFGVVGEQLLQDVQERLVFRAHMYIQTDIEQYNPSPGDVAYPEKLHMMQSIAESLHEQEISTLSRSDSLGSLSSSASQEVAKINAHHFSNSSPADMHGMWYPPVRRTLTCLSRMYRCVDRPIFQGISQEALTACMTSVKHASNIISERKTVIDGLMFLIKHLLILREQIAPFQVDFTVKEMSLDFSKMKTAAVELVNKRSRLFSLSSQNALLEFLIEGTPQVKQHWLDSRKDIDKTLKSSCESFILSARNHLLGVKLINILDKGETWADKEKLKLEEWCSCNELSNAVHQSIKLIKSNLPALQETMHLYLANRDTEFILYRPIKNSVIATYSRLQQLVSSIGYNEESMAQIGCPTPEQAAIMLSSVSLQPPVPAPNRKLSTDSQGQASNRKISTDSQGHTSIRKISTDSQGHISNRKLSAESQGQSSNQNLSNESQIESSNLNELSESQVQLNKQISIDPQSRLPTQNILNDAQFPQNQCNIQQAQISNQNILTDSQFKTPSLNQDNIIHSSSGNTLISNLTQNTPLTTDTSNQDQNSV